jgi:GNAT superfamily N-acetyltransferase
MKFREATIEDIPQMQTVRNSVKENVLSDPALVSYDDYVEYITKRGKGWVAEEDDKIVGFSVVDLVDKNIWALFVLPAFEKKGIGKQLQQLMLDWYFSQFKETLWLSTAPLSRADAFYRKSGWKDVGFDGKGEIKFEMSYEDWCSKH